MKSLQSIKREVLGLQDKNGQPIDPCILNLIVGLRAFGIPTQSSCAGHKEKKGSFPYVDIYADDTHISYGDYSKKGIKLKEKWIRENVEIQKKLISLLAKFYKTRKVEYEIQITPHTVIDWAWVRLKCAGSDLLKNMQPRMFEKKLLKYQSEMKAFGEYLAKKDF